jgi:hypothetical protein
VPNALDVQTLHLDCGYDVNITTECYKTLGLTDIVCAKKRGKGGGQRSRNPSTWACTGPSNEQLLAVQLRRARGNGLQPAPHSRPVVGVLPAELVGQVSFFGVDDNAADSN